MWDLQMANPLGRLSMRKLLSFVAALLVTVFAYTLFSAPAVHAADAAWNGGNLSYKSNQYNAMADTKAGDSTALPAGSKVFGYSTNPADGQKKAYLIYFDPGIDPRTATSAKAVNYDYTPPSTYSNKSSIETISVDSSSANNPTASCTVEGVGWIVCNLSTFLAQGMDNIFNFMTGFVAVQPIQTSNQQSPLYKAWDIMRSFANVVFIIGFLVIIFSQLTSTGVSNYGIKKLLPRLIIAAVLVNISYYVCAVAVDVTNILGYSLQHIFIQIRQDLFQIHGNTWSGAMGNWESVTGFVLSGGATTLALGAGGVAALAATGGTVTAAIFLLLPILVGALITVLVVMLILAARQAIIVILIIISPLAFVAYLLPGTEKWFEKWRDLFMTMMIFFPAFSLVFGGAQLAGAVIIQNATSINIIILGLAVQIAPLAIAPLLMKLSGGFLNRIAGIVNNPGKGLVDRTRKWAGEQADMHKQRGLGDGEHLSRRNFLRNGARSLDNRKRRLAERTSNYSAMSDNRYNATSGHQELDMQRRQVEEAKHIIEKELEIKWNAHVEIDKHALEQDLKLRVLTDESSKSKAHLDARYEEFKAGTHPTYGPQTQSMVDLLNRSQDATLDIALTAMRDQSAKRAQQEELTTSLKDNVATIDGKLIQDYAGGIQGAIGAQRSLASAIQLSSKAHSESISNASTILEHGNYTDDQIGEVALGQSGTTGITITDDIQEAAIRKIAGGGNTTAIQNLLTNMDLSTSVNQDFRQALGDTLLANSSKPKFVGAGTIAAIKQGISEPPGKARIDKWVVETINADKLGGADILVTQDKEYLNSVFATLQNNQSGLTIDSAALTTIKNEITKAKTSDLYSAKIGERKEVLDNIFNKIP